VSYEQMQALYEKYHDKGFEILAFPCNQFGGQEPGTDVQIKEFAKNKFGVTFPLFSKIDVNGSEVDPLWEFLKNSIPGIMGSTSVKWNFTKFLCNKNGIPVERFGTQTPPFSFEENIVKLLEEQ